MLHVPGKLLLQHYFLFTVDGVDYQSGIDTNNTFTFDAVGVYENVTIPIKDNTRRDSQRFFLFAIKSDCNISTWLQIFIWDDDRGRLFKLPTIIFARGSIPIFVAVCVCVCVCVCACVCVRMCVCVYVSVL